MRTKAFWNGARHDAASTKGHYESWFQRANHPTDPQAFWIRYTIFHAKGSTNAEGELWGMWFDGAKNEILKVYAARPLSECSFASDGLNAKIGAATLDDKGLRGALDGFAWDLRYAGDAPPALIAPEPFYFRALPKAKVLTASPLVRYDGTLTLPDGRVIDVRDWPGCQSHNWGTKHTDLYVWCQVAGFDGAPDVFLECATAKLKIGGLWMPKLTPLVLQIDGEQIALNEPRHLWGNKGDYGDWKWHVEAKGPGIRVRVDVSAPKDLFVPLPYRNPPGGVKRCLNSKIARCELTIERDGKPTRTLVSKHGAAFEILGDPARLDALGFQVS